MASPLSVLVTGSSGTIGRATCLALRAAGHNVTGLDRISAETTEVVADILDRPAVAEACEGMDVVIHLAACVDEADFIEEIIEPNVRGLYHAADGARRAGVTRLVLASSVQAVSGHLSGIQPVRIADGPKPVNHYALTKVWAEHLCEMYARIYGLSVITARIGWCIRNAREARGLMANAIGRDLYLSHDDAGRFFLKAATADSPRKGESCVLFATSIPTDTTRLDISDALATIGYEPRDRFPEGLPFALPDA